MYICIYMYLVLPVVTGKVRIEKPYYLKRPDNQGKKNQEEPEIDLTVGILSYDYIYV